jgi:pimeloyl-ACP methyl ester carboxylesterase
VSASVLFASRRSAALLLAAGASVALLAAGAPGTTRANAATPGAAATQPTVAASAVAPALKWGSCHNPALGSGYQCATLQVPIDGEEVGDSGPTFGLALDRHQATGHKIGSLLINPGGPGESGVDELPGLVEMLSSGLQTHFDIIGFDPPGVGASDPITCLSSTAYARYLNLDPAPPTPAGVSALVAGNRTFAQGCEADSRAILPHVSTVAAARDMDRIRQAVGDPKLTYIGFSYGTLLGATYAGLYPTKVRAMDLDGALDPALAPVPMIESQAVAIDGQLRQLEASCAESSSCPWHAPKGVHAAAGSGPDGSSALAAAYQALLTQVRAHPLKVSGTNQTVGPAQLLYGTAAGLYSTQSWPAVEQALADATSGHGNELLSLFDQYVGYQSNGTYQNTFEAESAVNCLDAPAPSVSQLVADGRSLQAKAPVFGLLDLYSEMTCSVWPVPATGKPQAIHADGSPPIVVVGSTGDPVTPYAWAVSLAHELQHGVLLTRVGDGHTGYGASTCVQTAIDAYLIDLKPPRVGERCPSN